MTAPRAPQLRASPFHVRAAEINRLNAWTSQNGVALAAHYGDPEDEALAARFTVAVFDLSGRWRVHLSGAKAGALMGRLFTRKVAALAPGRALHAAWCADGGGLRGTGAAVCLGENDYLLVSATPDPQWIADAAHLFGVRVEDRSETEAGLAIIGPFARALLSEAGLAQAGRLEDLECTPVYWRGIAVTLSRWGSHGGWEIWCAADDAVIVWDRLRRAGTGFGLRFAGADAAAILDLEAGIPRAGRDYTPVRSATGTEPSPFALGLSRLVDLDAPMFNGRAALAATPESVTLLCGLELEARHAMTRRPILRNGKPVGSMLGSAWSPALRSAIALAKLPRTLAEPGTTLSVAAAGDGGPREIPARVAALPFLPAPDQIGA